MKTKRLLRACVLIVMAFSIFAFTNLQPQKDNQGNKNNNEQGRGNGNRDQGDNGQGRGNNGQGRGNSAQSAGKDIKKQSDRGRNDNNGNSNAARGNNGNGNRGRSDKPGQGSADDRGRGNNGSDKKDNGKPGQMNASSGNPNNNNQGRRNQVKFWKDGEIDWNFNDFASRKNPRDQKKVTLCHQTGDEFPVTINVSENAVQAHMNHGDQTGGCNINYSDRWTPGYIRTRENVYNTYEQTWETMSYSEALLRYAAERLLGIRSNFDQVRLTLTPQEVQRREALILDLQNNVNALETQLDLTRQRADNINIFIQL